jgi:hypothetical protein
MTADEFRAILDRLGASPAGFAGMIGAAPRVSQRWAQGRDAIPPAVAALARVADGVGAKLPYGELAALLRAEAARLDAAAQERTTE